MLKHSARPQDAAFLSLVIRAVCVFKNEILMDVLR